MNQNARMRLFSAVIVGAIVIVLLGLCASCASLSRDRARLDEMSEVEFDAEIVDLARRGRLMGGVAIRAGVEMPDIQVFVAALRTSASDDPISEAASVVGWTDPEVLDAIAEIASWFDLRGGLPVGDRLRAAVDAFAAGVEGGAMRAIDGAKAEGS